MVNLWFPIKRLARPQIDLPAGKAEFVQRTQRRDAIADPVDQGAAIGVSPR
jgi:hypothetical protein